MDVGDLRLACPNGHTDVELVSVVVTTGGSVDHYECRECGEAFTRDYMDVGCGIDIDHDLVVEDARAVIDGVEVTYSCRRCGTNFAVLEPSTSDL